MLEASCAKTLVLVRTQFKLILLNCFLISAVLLLLINIFFGTRFLDSFATGTLLVRYVSLIGIIFMTPLFFPEQDKNIAEVVQAKYVSHLKIIFGRLALAIVLLFLMVLAMLFVLHIGECEFPFYKYLYGTFITAFALGALGFFGVGITNNIILGYMLPICYYILNFGLKEKLGHFYLFSMSKASLEEKYYLFAAAVVLILVTFLCNYIVYKKR